MTVNRLFVATMALGLWLCATDASAYHTIYKFQGRSDGAYPNSVVADAQGNLYGTADQGGDKTCQCGIFYRLSPTGEETVLYRFTGGSDGAFPDSNLVWGADGNLYGATSEGGNGGCIADLGCGTVFRVTPDGIETTLYRFTGGHDGAEPSSLYIDTLGDLFGTATAAGAGSCLCGTLFKLAPDGTFTILHEFKGGDDGSGPLGPLVPDANGDLFGTTSLGGGLCTNFGCGTVFELTTDGALHILHAFGKFDGSRPAGSIVRDAAGNIYGSAAQDGPSGEGLVFKLTPDGSESSLHVFEGGTDGGFPGGLSADAQGNLYGAALGGPTCDCGTVFTIGGSGTFDVLHTFRGRPNGATFFSDSPLYVDKRGHIYGELTKESAGNNGPVCCGLVFALHR